MHKSILLSAVLTAAFAVFAAQGDKPLTGEEILAKPRAAVPTLTLPPEGLFFGPATYGWESTIQREKDGEDDVTLGYAGHTHCRWVAGQPAPWATIEMTKKYNQGNIIQFWQTGELLYKLSAEAARQGLYAMNIYAPDNPPVAQKLCGLGDRWIGYDTGEIFSFRGDDVKDLKNPTLKDVTDAFMRRVYGHVSERHAHGWGNVLSTGGDFSMDLQVMAGIDIPLTEDYPMRNQLVSSALERGIARQFNLPLWGTHQAHEWNVFIPYSNPLRQPVLGATFQIKYMTGAKIIINESGNWEVQTTLCEDSPMHKMPHVNPLKTITGDKKKIREAGFDLDAATAEAKKLAHLVGWKSEVSQEYRKICSDFWNFVKENPAPKGQPEATVAVIKGNYDLSGEHNEPMMPIGGAQILADNDPNWYPGAPEDTWELVKKVLSPRPAEILYPSKNFFLSGSPYGLYDITSFAYDNISAEFLLKHYKTLMFGGWNTCSPKQYRVLCDYVKGGGRLLVALPHLSCNATRKHNTFKVSDLVNGGDFSELCGVKVKGQGSRIWWATTPDVSGKPNALGIKWPRRYGNMALKVGDLEYTRDASAYEKLAVEDEGGDTAVILRTKTGKGEVFFVNTWCYPSQADLDEGPGASFGSRGLMSELYAYVAKISRGSVYVDGVGAEAPDGECDYVVCSYFPEDGRIFLKNIDFRKPHRFDLVRNGARETIVLAPAEMRILTAAK